MSDTATKREFHKALREAHALMELIGENCAHRWEIAGSIRRGRMMVGDVEHVVMARMASTVRPGTMFAETVSVNKLHARLDELLEAGEIEKARYGPSGRTCWGDRQRGVAFCGFNHEFFFADDMNWGAILAIRTGPAEFARHMVQQMRSRGVYVQGGLENEHPGYVCLQSTNEPVACETEEDWFAMCGATWLDPHLRGQGGVHRREEATDAAV